MKIKGNEEADKAAKQAVDMPDMTTTRLQPNYKEGKKLGTAKEENSISKLKYIKPCIEECESDHNSCRHLEVKLSTLHIGYIRLTHTNTT